MSKKESWYKILIKFILLLFLAGFIIGGSVFFVFLYLFKSGQLTVFANAKRSDGASKVYRYPRLELENLIKAKIFDINFKVR